MPVYPTPPGTEEEGAFYNAMRLKEVVIPESVKSIGPYAFANTSLKEVTIAQDCIFYETSFPEGCEIKIYG